MKLIRFGEIGRERPGLLDQEGRIRDLADHCEDFGGANASIQAFERIRNLKLDDLPIVHGKPRIGAPLSFVPNFFCIGLNYAKHAAETGLRIPREPIIFSKASSALAGPFDDIELPQGSEKNDWEIELGVLIGQEAYCIDEAEALDYVSAYFTVNDLSERHFQTERSGQWIKGKSCPGYGPIGPWLVTPDEIDDVQNLDLSLKRNGVVVQSSNTSDMIFGVARIISYMSQFMKLQVGDIIATGTPEGVGMSMEPPQFLQKGDVLEGGVLELGLQIKTVYALGLTKS